MCEGINSRTLSTTYVTNKRTSFMVAGGQCTQKYVENKVHIHSIINPYPTTKTIRS